MFKTKVFCALTVLYIVSPKVEARYYDSYRDDSDDFEDFSDLARRSVQQSQQSQQGQNQVFPTFPDDDDDYTQIQQQSSNGRPSGTAQGNQGGNSGSNNYYNYGQNQDRDSTIVEYIPQKPTDKEKLNDKNRTPAYETEYVTESVQVTKEPESGKSSEEEITTEYVPWYKKVHRGIKKAYKGIAKKIRGERSYREY